MSYLSADRFVFSGKFQADVSTVNNVVTNYGENQPKIPVWNPNGTGIWAFSDCTVQSATTAGVADPGDPVLGMSLASGTSPAPAKLVDLDPEQQVVSEVWGMRLALGDSGAENSFSGAFRVVGFCDMWGRCSALQNYGSSSGSAFYQSILTGIEWGSEITSPVLEKLANGGRTTTLSIKFNVDMHDNFNPDQGPPPDGYPVDTYPFTYGRVVGTIGPYVEGEPLHFVSGRLLRTPTGTSFYYAPCVIEGDRIFVDLGNSTPTEIDGSIDPNLGNLRLAVLEPDATDPDSATARKVGAPSAEPQQIFPEPLEVDGYMTDASIQQVAFDPGMLQTLENAPLGVVQVDDDGNYLKTVLAEAADGWFARADTFVYRFDPGDTADVLVRATRFGVAAVNGTQIDITKAPLGQIGDPELKALTVPSAATVATDGWARFAMSGDDPGYPRQQAQTRSGRTITLNLDGQIYAVTPSVHGARSGGEDPWLFVSVLIFTDWQKVASDFDNPTWNGDVEVVLSQYGWLYPYMSTFFDLSKYDQVVQNIGPILTYMGYPRTDPRHMPVTRDLSSSKLQLIKNWQANGTPLG